MNVGLHQTGPTCWFNSSLNLFLLSDNGLKILWKKLHKMYASFGPKQREFFNSNIEAPCPYTGGAVKTSQIFFWKFLNQYLCAKGGPGSLLSKSGLNARLTKNIRWLDPAVREAKGQTGAWPAVELPTILRHLGFKNGGALVGDFRINDFDRWIYRFKQPGWREPIMMFRRLNNHLESRSFPLRDLMREKMGYELTAGTVYVKPFSKDHEPHVWACVVRNGKGYINDSNKPLKSHECAWWSKNDLEAFFINNTNVNNNYRPGKAYIAFELVMYTRKSFTNSISPRCELPKAGYRALTSTNKSHVNELANFNSKNLGRNVNIFTPLSIATAKRRNAARPLMTAAILNSLVNRAGSFIHGLRLASALTNANGRKYKINKNGPNYVNFRRKLIAKFPRKMDEAMYKYFWRKTKTNKEIVENIHRYALRNGYTVPNLQAILNRRAGTRAGVKRKLNENAERIYVIKNGSNTWWYNNSGNWVPNPNLSAWEPTNNRKNSTAYLLELKNFPAGTNVTVYKRK